MKKRLLIIVASGFLFSCADTRSHITTNKTETKIQQAKTKNVTYTCNRNTHLSVNFTYPNNESEQSIVIINGFGKKAIILPNKAIASGFLFSNGKYTLRGKGEKITWTVGRMAPFQCSVNDKLTLKENVK
ncbi:MAG: MliC family protein [Colwellia sp.]|nr:MliC family protein [Colwellia sp.]